MRGRAPKNLQELIGQATYGMEEDAFLVRALRRGIAVHHSGCPKKYRQVVEILFRCGYLRVVIATGKIVIKTEHKLWQYSSEYSRSNDTGDDVDNDNDDNNNKREEGREEKGRKYLHIKLTINFSNDNK